MKTLFLKILAFVPILAIIAMTNWYVDPANIFSGKESNVERRIAEIMLSGQNVELYNWNINERLILKYYIESLDSAPDVLILGSSRAMQINSSMFPGKKIFNSSSAGAALEDYVIILQMFREKKLLPEKVVIGVDPWDFNINNDQNRWSTLTDEYNRGLEWLGIESDDNSTETETSFKESLELFSLGYFQTSVKLILKGQAGDPRIEAVSSMGGENTVRMSDGSREYSAEWRNRTSEEVKALAIEYASGIPVYSLGSFRVLDENYIRIFEALVDELTGMGIEVALMLPPYHPTAYKILTDNPDYRIIDEVEKYVIEMADKRGIKLIGSYDPENVGAKDTDFFDASHTSRTFAEQYFDLGN